MATAEHLGSSRVDRRGALALGYLFGLAGAIVGSWAARLADVKEQLGASPGPLGIAMLAGAIGSFAAMLVAPRIVRRVGVAAAVIPAACAACVSVTLAASAPSLVVLAVALCGLGVANGLSAIGLGMLAVTFQEQAGRPIVNRFHGCHSGGGLVGALLGAAAGLWLSPSAHMCLLAVAGLVGVGIVRRWLPPAEGRGASTAGAAVGASVNRRLLAVSWVASAAAFAEGTVVAWGAVHLREELGAASAVAALGFAAQALLMVIVRSSGTAVLERWTPRAVVRTAGWVTAFGATVVATAPAPAIAIVGCATIGAGVALVFPTATAVAGASQDGAVGRRRVPTDAFAVAMMIGAGGALLSGPIVGAVAEVGGTRAGFAAVAGAGVLVAALVEWVPFRARHAESAVTAVLTPALD